MQYFHNWDAFRRRDVYVEDSDRWGDSRAKLIQEAEWETQRTRVCNSIGHHSEPDETIIKLEEQLDAKYKKVAENFVDK